MTIKELLLQEIESSPETVLDETLNFPTFFEKQNNPQISPQFMILMQITKL